MTDTRFCVNPDDPEPYTKRQARELYLEQVEKDLGFGLPEEARQAILTGGNWEHIPETWEELMWIPEPCDSEDCPYDWHSFYQGYGFRVEEGMFFLLDVQCDCDGDWDVEGSGLSLGEFQKFQETDQVHRKQLIREYYEYVFKTGNDPCDCFYVRDEERQRWEVKVKDWVGNEKYGVLILGGKRKYGKIWYEPEDLPETVQYYMGQVKECSYYTSKFVHSTKELRSKNNVKMVADRVQLTIDERRSAKAMQRDLRKLAKQYLKRREV